MKIEWSSKVVDETNNILQESNKKPNLIMDAAAAVYLHLLEHPTSGIYDYLNFVILTDDSGNMNTDQLYATDEIERITITSSDISVNDNVITIAFMYENTTVDSVEVFGKGLVCGGMAEVADAGNLLETGILFSKFKNDEKETIPPNCVLLGSITITVEV